MTLRRINAENIRLGQIVPQLGEVVIVRGRQTACYYCGEACRPPGQACALTVQAINSLPSDENTIAMTWPLNRSPARFRLACNPRDEWPSSAGRRPESASRPRRPGEDGIVVHSCCPETIRILPAARALRSSGGSPK